MALSFESQSWYRAAHLRPVLARRAEVTRQQFRGQVWYVIRDPLTGKYTRITEAAHWLVAQMDGQRTLGEVWDAACAELADAAPAQDDLLALISQLAGLDLLHTNGFPDVDAMSERAGQMRRRTLVSRFLNPLAVRFPLFDPNALLDALWPLARPFFSLFGGLLYLLLLAAGAVQAGRNWDALTGNLLDRILAMESVLLLVLVYPLVKLLHEFGHGFAVKKWGGEVREVGVMFLVFIPVPYVDASASTSYTSKWRRILVSGAGILVELGLASAAMLLWLQLEDGILRAACFNVMLIGGISTLLFNGNPLLRFDGYFVFSDLLEIPNLSSRANRFIGYLIQRYAFGNARAKSPVRAKGERFWFFTYAISAFCYRLLISATIVLVVATRFFALGVLLALWSLTLIFLLPIIKHLKFVATSDSLRGIRHRAVLAVGLVVGLLVGALGFMPVPYRTVAQGIVYAPYEATIHATEIGEVARLIGTPGDRLAAGAPVLTIDDPLASARLEAAEADARKYRLRYEQALSESAYDVRLWRAQAAKAEQEADQMRDRLASMTLLAPREGLFVLPDAADLEGKFLMRGDVVGYIVDPQDLVVRVAVHQDQADLIRSRSLSFSLRTADDLGTVRNAHVVREVPTLGHRIVSHALTLEGGGLFAPDPERGPEPHTLEPILQFDVATDIPLENAEIGMRVYVRIDHGEEPIAFRAYRRLRQLFLKRFNV
ncbi:PqqD family peptide modification chaperone [Antarctobacter jejuensis]|uniref:PqqD family peptide modification chaperone n=1 Tax=Antarctobacter jejuensis TaxID=1439938 RepID=UPI003FD50CDE